MDPKIDENNNFRIKSSNYDVEIYNDDLYDQTLIKTNYWSDILIWFFFEKMFEIFKKILKYGTIFLGGWYYEFKCS